MRKLGRGIGWLVKALLAVAGVTVALAALLVAFAWSPPGKALAARILAARLSSLFNGTLEIGQIRGNLLKHLTASQVKLRDRHGRVIATVAQVTTEHELDFRHRQIVVSRVQIEQPRLERADWAHVLRKKPEEKPKNGSKSREDEPTLHPLVWIQEIRLIEGRFETIHPINVDVFLPERLVRLPEGRIFAGGSWRGLPLKLAGHVGPRPAAPGSLSAIGKGGVPLGGPSQAVAFVGSLGQSSFELAGSGLFDVNEPLRSEAELDLKSLHYVGAELQPRLPSLPRPELDARSRVSFKDHAAQGELEAHVEKSGKLLVVGGLRDLPRPTVVRLERVELTGRCPLLKLARPTELRIAEDDVLPMGAFELQGCAGSIRYGRDGRSLGLAVRELQPGLLLDAASLTLTQAQGHNALGKLSATLELPRGPRQKEASLEARWDRSASETLSLQAGLRKRHLAAHAVASVAGEALDARAELDRVFRAQGWELDPKTAHGLLEISAQRFNLERLTAQELLPPGTSGRLTARLLARGSLFKTRLHLDARGEGLAANGFKQKINAEAHADYDARDARLVAKVEPPGQGAPITAVASARLEQESVRRLGFMEAGRRAPMSWSVQTHRLDLTRLLSTFQYQGVNRPPFYATLDAHGEGSALDPRARLKLALDTSKGKFATLEGALDGNQVTGSLIARGANTDPVAAAFTDTVHTEKGKLDADFHVAGKTSEPDYSGFIRLRADKLTLPLLGTSYDQVALDVKGNSRRIDLEDLAAKSGGGGLSAKGILLLTPEEAAQALSLSAHFQNFELLSSEQMRVRSTGSASLTANRLDASFHGDVNISEGTLELPESKSKKHLEGLGELDDVKYARKSESDEGQAPGLFDRLHGGIKLRAPGHFWVQSKDKSIAVELSADLEGGLDEDADTFLTGTVKTVRGNAELFGRRFELRPSEVAFDGDPGDPQLDVQAVYPASQWNILVSLQGDLKTIKPQLTSDPPGLSQEECVGVLLTGSPTFQNKGGAGGGGAGAVASNVATGYLVGKLKTELGPKLPFDTLTADLPTERSTASTSTVSSTEPTTTGGGSSYNSEEGRSKIEVGKYITDRIFVRLGHVFSTADQSSIDKLVVDYRLNSRWSVQTSQTDQGTSDLQVLWTLNY